MINVLLALFFTKAPCLMKEMPLMTTRFPPSMFFAKQSSFPNIYFQPCCVWWKHKLMGFTSVSNCWWGNSTRGNVPRLTSGTADRKLMDIKSKRKRMVMGLLCKLSALFMPVLTHFPRRFCLAPFLFSWNWTQVSWTKLASLLMYKEIWAHRHTNKPLSTGFFDEDQITQRT